MISDKVIQSVSQEIYRQFPQVRGCKPSVRRQSGSSADDPLYLMIFKNNADQQLPVTTYVRVVVNPQGKIHKISTSR